MGKTVNPAWVTGHYRFENDDGTLNTSTFKAAQDTTITQAADENFRLRFNWGESAGQTTSTQFGATLQFRINGGSWTTVTSSTAVFASASSNETDGASSSTERLTTRPTGVASFANNRFEESDGYIGFSPAPADQCYECVWNLQINSASVSNGDTIEFQIIDSVWSQTVTTVDTTPSLTASVSVNITGTVAYTETADTVSASGTVLNPITGTVAYTETADTVSASGALGFSGTISYTESADTVSASGTMGYSGTVSYTETADTVSASGSLGFSGTVAYTEAADTVAASGTVTQNITGTVAYTEADDTVAASGSLGFSGTVAYTEASDTVSASGTVTSTGITGTVAYTETADTVAASGALGFIGNISYTEANDNIVATGSVILEITGTIAYTEANDTVSAIGFIPSTGSSFGLGAAVLRRRRRI